MSTDRRTPRPAATLILARDGAEGLEVFMVRRSEQASFVGGAHVFPGGTLDAQDRDPLWAARCAGLDDASASARLGIEVGGLAYWIAAIRECFEEAGLLLARDASGGEPIALDSEAAAREYGALRDELIAGELGFRELCEACDLRLATDELAYWSHWITPAVRPQRFDARFFVAAAPARQTASHDARETVENLWIRPAEALERQKDGAMQLVFATITTLKSLAHCATAGELMAHARSQRAIATNAPHAATGRDGMRLLLPGDYAHAEVARLDPEGRGTASYEIIPGVATRLSATVRRVTAPNPSFMTGPGTNSYLIGSGGELAVIDPGPALESHVDSILDEAGGRVRWILCTHTHIDHSPAAALLRRRTGAELIGMPAPEGASQDRAFAPGRVPRHGERLEVGGCALRVIHTPGHASNHLCYLHEQERLLFTGDHIMQGSTVVISPPDGDMRAYLDSLRALLDEDIEYLAPGHGFLMARPREVVERLLAHRRQREDKVIAALRARGRSTVNELVPLAYDEVPPRVHGVAARSLLAHLLKLADEGRATEFGGQWELAG